MRLGNERGEGCTETSSVSVEDNPLSILYIQSKPSDSNGLFKYLTTTGRSTMADAQKLEPLRRLLHTGE
jgi:hypothetical protein